MTGATFAVINAGENGWTCAATAVGGVVAVASATSVPHPTMEDHGWTPTPHHERQNIARDLDIVGASSCGDGSVWLS
jgi:hypothetical protein